MPDFNYSIRNKDDDSVQYVNHAEAWQLASAAMDKTNDVKQKQKIMSDYLQGIKGGINTQNMKAETQGEYSKAFKDVYSNADRKKQLSKRGSLLWQKNKNAETIKKEEVSRQKKMSERAEKAIQSAGYDYSAASPVIVALSSFMTGSKRSNTALLRSYAKGETKQVLSDCINEFISLDLERLDLKSDKKTAENAATLEKLSERFSGIQYLITTFSDAYSDLPEDLRIAFEEYYGKANTVVTQYRLKKIVMTNSYYITHENREIGSDLSEKMTVEQRNLAEMIWQSKGGLSIFLNRTEDYLKNAPLKKLAAALQRDGVSKERLSLQDRIRKRREDLEKRGLSDRMDDFLLRERNLNVKGTLGVIGHARNLTALKLTGDPDDDLSLLPEIMDQRDVVEQTEKMRKDSKNTYYMEQSDLQIAASDTAVTLLSCLKHLEQDLLIIGRLTRGGAIDTSQTQEEIEVFRRRYADDLLEYNEKMRVLKVLRNSKYELPPEESPENAVYTEENAKENEEKKDPVSKAKELISSLYSDKLSDYSIYQKRDEICALSKKCKGTDVSGILDILSKRAVFLWRAKRLLNVNAALSCDKDNEALKAEAESLKAPENDDTMEAMLKLRAEAEKNQFDFQDLRALASHYTRQYDWAVTSKGDGGRDLFLLGAGLYYKTLSKVYGSDRDRFHGEEKYDEAVERLNAIPGEITAHEDGTPLLLQKGDASVPPIDITKYYEDTFKDELKAKIGEIKNALSDHEKDYPEELLTALSSIEHYTKIKYIVTADTTEMEMAFLDKFQKEMDRAFLKMKKVSFTDPVTKGMLEIMSEIATLGRGKLRDKDNPNRISDAEFEAALEQPAIHMEYSKNDLNESNVKDIPLFTHRPHMNDIKQGNVGDCYFMAAVTSFVQSNPEEVMNMFYDIGDGNVLVRLYMGFDNYNRRVDTCEDLLRDDVTLRPVYIKVRKDYDPNTVAVDCMWVQLLEKAYASTGAQHKTIQVDPVTGKMTNFITEVTSGDSQKMLIHLTGNKDCWEHEKPKRNETTFTEEEIEEYRMRSILSGVPSALHFDIWKAIKKIIHEPNEEPDAWENRVVEAVRKEVVKKINDWKDFVNNVETDIIKNFPDRSPEDFAAIKKKYLEKCNLDPDILAEKVRKNLHTEAPAIGDGTDLSDPADVMAIMLSFYENKLSVEDIIAKFDEKTTYYEPLNFNGDEKEQANIRKHLAEYASSQNKAMIEYNPNDRYTPEEMIFLHDARDAAKRKEGMCFAVPYHMMNILDTQFKDGRWYLLVRDTFNVRNYSYETKNNGELSKKEGKTSYDISQSVRQLDGDIKTGFLGTSWWELSTIFDKMQCYCNSPKVK